LKLGKHEPPFPLPKAVAPSRNIIVCNSVTPANAAQNDDLNGACHI
jgi:hypothetical protein